MRNKYIVKIMSLLIFSILFIVSTDKAYATSFTKKGTFTNLGPTEQVFQINKGFMYHNKNNEQVLYGGTIVMGGSGCTFFSFNTSTKKIEKMIPIPNSEGIISMTADENFIYFGTYNNASLYRYDINTEKLDKLADIKNDNYAWDVKAYGNRVYIATSPRSRIYKYYLKEKVLEDLGSFSNDQYARAVEYHNGKIYAGIGSKAALIEYDEKTKTKRNLLPAKYKDQFVHYLKIVDSKLFAVVYPSYAVISYDFNTKKVTERMDKISNRFYDYYPQFNNNFVTFQGVDGYIFHYDKANDTLKCLQYNGNNLTCSGVVNNNRIAGINQDGYYYENDLNGHNPNKIDLVAMGLKGGVAKPIYMYPYNDKIYFGGKRLSIYDVNSKTSMFRNVQGEVKSISILNNSLYTGNYPEAKLWKYDKTAIDDPSSVDFTNNTYFLKQIPIEQHQNRPSKMISNPKSSTVTVLSEPLPGQYGGTVTTYNEKTGSFYIRKDVVPNQYIHSIAYDTEKSQIAYLGSSSIYGYGSKSLNDNAHLVKYDVITQSKLFDMIPEAGNRRIMSVAHSGNKVYCVTHNGTLVCVDSNNGKIVKKVNNFWYREILSSVDGNLYGITNKGFWRIDKNTLNATCIKNNLSDPTRLCEDPVTGKIYFYHNLNLCCYQ
ncbi:DUF5074 domain-containing protein [Clostridium lundense]|uniref:DUF5074 domain-containing protein n=1 Tax=Clostridium lundense TaxID=319475 RepID=UPI0004883407|nr:DUF5074 domain-containing protein [Clostridium lundense]